MSRHRLWMLSVASLLVIGTLGLGDKPESVADEVMQSPPRPEFGRDEAIAAIEKLGGPCKFDEESPDRPIIRVYLTGDRISDADLEHLKGMTSIQNLGLHNTQVTDADLEHLKGLISLQVLALYLPRATDAGLVHLKGLTRLQTLRLYNTQVTDAGLEHLKGLTSLRDLHLWNTQVTDDGVKELQEALPNCKARFGTDHF